MSEYLPLRVAVETLAERALPPPFEELEVRATRRGRRRVLMVVAATAALIAGSLLIVAGPDRHRPPAPAEQPKLVVGAVPVWYDAKGLHRGDIVEQTPVQILQPERQMTPDHVAPARGALALVRSGAVYLDPGSGDVWFHPWGGKPRVVGRHSAAGPGGDPNGDTAAWFEGFSAMDGGPGELVVYDTATGREVSRTREAHGLEENGGDHYPVGNRFLQVSAAHVVWAGGGRLYSHDVRKQTTTVVSSRSLDVHDDVEASGNERGIVVKVPGRPDARFPHLESHFRLSPSGNYLLAVEGTETRHAAAIVDTRTGELWRVPENAYPWIAWSYGDIALVDTEDGLLACNAALRACEPVPAERPVLMPTS